MDNKKIAKLANSIGLISIILLIYWVFTFLLITIFGLKVFRENITQFFYMSIIAILSLMFGSLMISIMFNMTSISDSLNKTEKDHKSKINRIKLPWKYVFIILFVFIGAGLFLGDYLTANKKRNLLVESAKQITDSYSSQLNKIVNYDFSKENLENISKFVNIISKSDRNFNHVSIITFDKIDNIECFLEFGYYYDHYKEANLNKDDFLFMSDEKQREYLLKVFKDNYFDYHFSDHDGNYELFYPYEYNGKIIVIFFNDYQQYGKIGS